VASQIKEGEDGPELKRIRRERKWSGWKSILVGYCDIGYHRRNRSGQGAAERIIELQIN
jgi:hypothetical protein